MSERKQYPPGVPCWVDTPQPDVEAAIRFYEALFGWQFIGPGPMPGEPPGKYFVARVRGRDVAGVCSQPPAGTPPHAVWNTYISVESVDATAEKVQRAGGTVVAAPFDALPAGRIAVLRDPAGASFCAWEAEDRQRAQLVNESQAWAMSALRTSDPNGAKAFYGAVFGWEADTFDLPEGAITLWRLPGYVGGEPQQPVPRDVVGVMLPTGSDPAAAGAQPHWNVDFWVKDMHAFTARAAELGANIVVPPYDTAAFRQSVVADPQGAVFSVSQLLAVA